MSETIMPMNVAAATDQAAVTQVVEGRRDTGWHPAAAGALKVVLKQPMPGTPSAEALAPGVAPSPLHNLRKRGGRTIQHLTYVNLYVGGQAAWAAGDIRNIDRVLAGAMTDPRLDDVINQYFNGGPVSTKVAPSRVLPGPKPRLVSRAQIDGLVQKNVVASGLLTGFDPASTVFNFLLPRGVVLTTDGGTQAAAADRSTDPPTVTTVTTIRTGNSVTTVTVATSSAESATTPDDDGDGGTKDGDIDDAASSLRGLGGYHGSVHIAGTVVYFAVGVYSERRPNGSENGIVAFDQPWKNVVATAYHELQEARTDPDVEDAIRTNNLSFIGWNSDQGEEIGDFPVFEAFNDGKPSQVFQEVPLKAGGTAPVQFMYSNRVNGPEGPKI